MLKQSIIYGLHFLYKLRLGKAFPKNNRGENDYNPNVDVSLKYEKLYASKLYMNNGFQFKVIR